LPFILSYSSSKKWYESLNSKETKRVFANRFKQYCDAVHKNPDELIALKIDGLRNITTEKEFQAEDLLDGFLYSGKITDSIAVGVKTAVKSFYSFNRRSLDRSSGKNVTAPEPKQRSPKLADLIELESAMLNPRDHALVWFISSGSFRDNELINLKQSDKLLTRKLLEDNKDPTRDPAVVQKAIEEISKDIPYYFVIEGSRLKGGGKGRYKRLKHIAFIHWYAAQKLDKYEVWIKNYLKTNLGVDLTSDMPLLISTRTPRVERLGSVNPIFQDASKRASILYLTSSSLETRNTGYSFEPVALLPVFGWPSLHLIPYLVLVAFSQIFSVGPPHMGHLKSFIYFHQKSLLL